MSLIGKIQSLFLDKEQTIPLFPRTKVNAVSDEDGVGLSVLLDEKLPKSGGTLTSSLYMERIIDGSTYLQEMYPSLHFIGDEDVCASIILFKDIHIHSFNLVEQVGKNIILLLSSINIGV